MSALVLEPTATGALPAIAEGTDVITADHLSKRFGRVVAVDDLSFRLKQGTITGFLGPNGSGKTTTLRMLLGLVKPTGGTPLLFGQSYEGIANPARRVGAVLEATDFHPGRSGRDHLLMLAYAADLPASRADEVLAKVDLAQVGRRRVGGYSMGMRQRLGLAAALLGDPELLILDEPANGLDPEGVHWLREFLRGFAAHGKTVFVSSHMLAEVAHTVEDVVIINHGKLVAVSSLADLLARSTSGTHVVAPDADLLRELLCARGLETRLLDTHELLVAGATPAEVGEIAGTAGLFLHELSSNESNLEDIFLKLTAKEA
jgi:ABC-2 type transport system ATP-binding protein